MTNPNQTPEPISQEVIDQLRRLDRWEESRELWDALPALLAAAEQNVKLLALLDELNPWIDNSLSASECMVCGGRSKHVDGCEWLELMGPKQ